MAHPFRQRLIRHFRKRLNREPTEKEKANIEKDTQFLVELLIEDNELMHRQIARIKKHIGL